MSDQSENKRVVVKASMATSYLVDREIKTGLSKRHAIEKLVTDFIRASHQELQKRREVNPNFEGSLPSFGELAGLDIVR